MNSGTAGAMWEWREGDGEWSILVNIFSVATAHHIATADNFILYLHESHASERCMTDTPGNKMHLFINIIHLVLW